MLPEAADINTSETRKFPKFRLQILSNGKHSYLVKLSTINIFHGKIYL